MASFLASSAIVEALEQENSLSKELLISAGWQEQFLRKDTPSGKEEAKIWARTISTREKYPDYFARKSIAHVSETSKSDNNSLVPPCEQKALDTVSIPPIIHNDDNARGLDYIKSFNDLPSIKLMRYDRPSLVIGFDTEFFYAGSGKDKIRFILSYQFAFYEPDDPDKIHEVVFLPVSKSRLSLWRMLSWILTEYNLCKAYDYRNARRWYATVKSGKRKKFKSPEEAYDKSVVEAEKTALSKQFGKDGKLFKSEERSDGGYTFDLFDFPKDNITLVCHYAQADISTFKIPKCEEDILDSDIIVKCTNIQGGLVSLQPICKTIKVVQQPHKFYSLSLNVRDTKCFAPAGQRSLDSLGQSISLPKLKLPYLDYGAAIEHMDKYFITDPVSYMEYAINDSVICLIFSGELWGINKLMPVTLTAGAVNVALPIIKEHLGIKNDKEFNLLYRGLIEKPYGKEKNSNPNGRRFKQKKLWETFSNDADILTDKAGKAYCGGLNECFSVEYVDTITHDFDLISAYPTCMSCIHDPDWNSEALITRTIEKRPLTLDDFTSPFDLMFGDITFEFPENVQFPCIPVNVNGSLIFPRTSEGLTKCYSSAPEMYLALHLGARIFARRVYVAKPKIMQDGSPSQCLYKVAKQFVVDRVTAKKIFGDKSFEQTVQKNCINSIYGKIAQNIKPKSSWNAYSESMEKIGGSALTSPVHACLITAGVRAILRAAMNQLSDLGQKCYSVTTDGFISNAPYEVVENLDLYGFKDIFGEARKRLTGSSKIWEEKHTQSSFLNFSTRGNISQDEKGVCAHNGFRASYYYEDENGQAEDVEIKNQRPLDRYITMSSIVQRTERVCSKEKHFTGYRNLSYHGLKRDEREDFHDEERERNLRMDFDMKRKPLEMSFKQVFLTVRGVSEEVLCQGEPKIITMPDVPNCEWINFDSVPYGSVAEYEMYRRVYDGMDCLRTKSDWAKFWLKIHAISSGNRSRQHITNVEWTILMSVVRGYRLGMWDIPALSDPKKTVQDKVDWINKFNSSGKKFTVASWKNCGRKDRKLQIISESDCQELLKRMIADSPYPIVG